MLSKHVGILESNKAAVMAILEVLRIFVLHFHNKLVVESD